MPHLVLHLVVSVLHVERRHRDLLSARVRRWIVQTVVRREEAIENRQMAVLMQLLQMVLHFSPRFPVFQSFLPDLDVEEMTAENIGCRRELLETVELLEPVNLTDFLKFELLTEET